MLADCIIAIVVTSFLAIIFFPTLVRIALKRYFSQVQMKLYSPFSIRGILLNGAMDIWGLSHLTIYISVVELSLRKFKIKLNLQNIQVFLTRTQNSLSPVNLIDGLQQPNILYNFLYILKNHGSASQSTNANLINPQNNKKKQAIQFFLQAIIHLAVIFVSYLVEINLNHCNLFVVSSFPLKKARFQTKQLRKQTLMLMQCLAQYSLKCNLVTVMTTLQHHLKYKLICRCDTIRTISLNHWKNAFVQVKEGQVQISVPFSMSILQSLKQLDFTILISSGTINLIPSDFDLFFQFLKQLKFDPHSAHRQLQQAFQHSFQLFIGIINVNLRDIYEANIDNLQTKEYLLNIASARLTLETVRLEQNKFSVDMSSLSIDKFLAEQSLIVLYQVLKLPNLCIQSIRSEFKTEITHDEVIISCQSEQIVLFGKIFSIINSRIRFECYNAEIYRELKRNYIPEATLISQMEKMINLTKLYQGSSQGVQIKNQYILVYIPKKLVVHLEMKKLRHVITFDGFKYIRYHNFNEMSHQIFVNKATVQYRNLKEFVVTDFTLIFSQTIAEDQLSIQIKDIAMIQNEETLTDYLDSFTLFKHLLQFQSDEQQQQTKLAKKQISIDHISVTLHTEIITLKQLQIDQNYHVNQILSNLYFSLGKCEVVLSKLKDQRQLFKYSANGNHSLFSIDALTVRTNYQLRHSKPKQKIMVYLKDPCFILPEIDISNRILKYISMYARMKNHIEAYFINVTNEKLISLKYHVKQFLVQPQHILIKIANLNLSIADTKLNTTILAFSQTVRDYLSHQPTYNQSQLINLITRNNKTKYPLLSVKIQLLSIQVTRIDQLDPNQSSINKWITDFQQLQPYRRDLPLQEQTQRLRSVKAGKFKFKARGLLVKIRDYPRPIVSIAKLVVEGSVLKAKRIFGQRKNYLSSKMQVIGVEISVGLGQLSGLQEINKRINELNVSKDSQLKSISVENGGNTMWHKILQDWKWLINVHKPSCSLIELLTGDNPYSSQKFEIVLQQIIGKSETDSTSFELVNLQLKLKQFILVKLPIIQVVSKTNLSKHQFQIETTVSIVNEDCILRISSWIIRYVQELPQLRKDWLLIYGIYDRDIQTSLVQMQDIQNMSYLQIANLLANHKINSKDSHSVFNFIRRLQINCYISCIKIALIQQQLQMAINLLNVATFAVIKPNHELYNKWQVIRSKITVGQFKANFGKLFTELQISNPPELLTSKIDTSILRDNKIYQFMRCKHIQINFNWYFIDSSTVGLANVWIKVSEIQAQISKKIERYCSRILKLFFKNHKIKQKKDQAPAQTSPIKKFREAVLQVIRINRRNKIRQGHIKKYNLVVQIQNYSFQLVSDATTMKLTSSSNARFYYSIDYSSNDHYHSKPQANIIFLLPSSSIALCQQSHNQQRQVVKTGRFKLQICKASQAQIDAEHVDRGICEFEDIYVQLSQKSKQILQNIIFLIVDLVNSNQVRRQKYRVQTQKYSQLVNNQRQKLKDKIQWKQSDLKWSEQKVFEWKFNFKTLSMLLLSYSLSQILDIFLTLFQITTSQIAQIHGSNMPD